MQTVSVRVIDDRVRLADTAPDRFADLGRASAPIAMLAKHI